MPETIAAINQANRETGRVWKFLFWVIVFISGALAFIFKDSISFYKSQLATAQQDLHECIMTKYEAQKEANDKYILQLQRYQDETKATLDSVLANQSRGKEERQEMLYNQDIIKKKLSR